ncbi:pentatricopeptide repeat-containing protein At1g02370, mitochondrial [Raphanus sativus]|uniref:Pentatricopeptide repeat-containing protein At1g02370, mitochondrial n=1 Tax=Raphanus sativus TaxID=3726 RepID=A0A6J0LTP0_RAPSA|nr:pentatricopeptide repeat-containing protein At1g02370, mitochondrial [Raphanus sativus]
MASLELWKKIVAPLSSNGRMWKMACTTVAAPFSSGVESSAPVKVEKESSGPIKPEKQKVEKRKVFQKLKSLTVETIDLIIREEGKKGVFVDQEDLVRWARLLKNRKPENALEIFRWMDKKKMVFSPSQLELYVDLLGKVKGHAAASAYFNKVEPNFDEMDVDAKNRPAYLKVLHRFHVAGQSRTKGLIPYVLKYPKCDDNWNLLE